MEYNTQSDLVIFFFVIYEFIISVFTLHTGKEIIMYSHACFLLFKKEKEKIRKLCLNIRTMCHFYKRILTTK